MFKVYIDPGHGGNDTGAISHSGRYEKHLNLQMADLMRVCCNRIDVAVLASRYSDIDVVESHSAREANEWGADVYVALHCNGFANPAANGFEVLYWHTSDAGHNLAELLCASLTSEFPANKNRGARPRNSGDRGATVLSQTKMPAIIVEPGFITNPKEEEWLSRFSTQARIVESIVRAILVSFD